MLTFLRKVRKSLIDSGSTRRYLIYAIGEIALVVIGILIALQINNWNEWRKERIKEKEVLLEVKESLRIDSAYFASRISFFELVDNHFYDILFHVDNNLPYHDSLNLKNRLLTQGRNVLINASAFKRLESIGIDIIKNKYLKERILATYTYVYPDFGTSIQNYEKNIHEFGRPLIRRHFVNSGSLGMNYTDNNGYIPIDFDQLCKMPEFRNTLIVLKGGNLHQLNYAKDIQDWLTDLIKAIDEYDAGNLSATNDLSIIDESL